METVYSKEVTKVLNIDQDVYLPTWYEILFLIRKKTWTLMKDFKKQKCKYERQIS